MKDFISYKCCSKELSIHSPKNPEKQKVILKLLNDGVPLKTCVQCVLTCKKECTEMIKELVII